MLNIKHLTKTAIVLGLFSAGVHANNDIIRTVGDDYVRAGDTLQIAIPAVGLLAAWIHDDAEGAKQLAYSVASTQAIIHATKYAVARRRPNDSSWNSFPSGHTGAAFSGAAFLQTRYGSAWGLPAYAAATFVGASRVHGNRHFADDVVAGAGIAFLVNQYFTTAKPVDGLYINATTTHDGAAIGVSLSNDFFDSKEDILDYTQTPTQKKQRFDLGVGFNFSDTIAQVGANEIMAGSKPVDKFQPFAYANYLYSYDADSQLELDLSPNETRRAGIVSSPFSLKGKAYSKGDEVYTAFRQWSIGANYYKRFYDNDKLNVYAGLGASAYYVGLEVDRFNGGQYASDDFMRILPSASIKANYALTEHLSLLGKAQYQGLNGDQVIQMEAGIAYRINDDWEVGVKYAHSDAKWNKQNIKYASDSVVFNFVSYF